MEPGDLFEDQTDPVQEGLRILAHIIVMKRLHARTAYCPESATNNAPLAVQPLPEQISDKNVSNSLIGGLHATRNYETNKNTPGSGLKH